MGLVETGCLPHLDETLEPAADGGLGDALAVRSVDEVRN